MRLVPYPRVEIKFITQYHDKVCGNDFIHRSFGNDVDHHHKHLKLFLVVQKPTIETSNKSRHPNWEFCPILRWMN